MYFVGDHHKRYKDNCVCFDPASNLRRVRLLVDGIEPNLLAFLSEKDRNRHLQVEISEDGIQDELNEAQNEGLGDVREMFITRFGEGIEHTCEYFETMRTLRALCRSMATTRGCGGAQSALIEEIVIFLNQIIPISSTFKQVAEQVKEEFC